MGIRLIYRTSFTQVLDRRLEIEETHSCYVFGLKRFTLFKKVDIRNYFCIVFGNDVSPSASVLKRWWGCLAGQYNAIVPSVRFTIS